MSNSKIKVAFDVDGTLIHLVGSLEDTPRYDIISIYKSLELLGCDMYIWSGGGVDYAERWRDKLGLKGAKVVAKGSIKPDIIFDDMDTDLGEIDIIV